MLQSALVPGSGRSVPDGDGGSDDGISDGVEGHHHRLWQANILHWASLMKELMFSFYFRSWEMMVPRKR